MQNTHVHLDHAYCLLGDSQAVYKGSDPRDVGHNAESRSVKHGKLLLTSTGNDDLGCDCRIGSTYEIGRITGALRGQDQAKTPHGNGMKTRKLTRLKA